MLQLAESDSQQVYLPVVNTLITQRLAGMIEHGDITSEVRVYPFLSSRMNALLLS